VLFLAAEGGERESGSNVNKFLSNYGIKVNTDAAVRTVYYKYLHPKEVLVTNGVVNREIPSIAKKIAAKSKVSRRGGAMHSLTH
jgi:intraflagellar transport protein 52